MNSVRSNNLSLKYRRFKPSDCEDIEIRKFELVAKIQFLYKLSLFNSVLESHDIWFINFYSPRKTIDNFVPKQKKI